MNRCPHCGGEPCLPLWRKLTLGPGGRASCQLCGLRVAVDVVRAWLVMLPTLMLILVVGLGLMRDVVAMLLLLLLVLGGMFVGYVAWVPLRIDQLSNAAMVQAGRDRIAARRAGR